MEKYFTEKKQLSTLTLIMKKILTILIVFLLVNLTVKGQTMDTIKVENTLNQIITALKGKSFIDFKKVLFEKENYLDLAKKISGRPIIESSELDKSFQSLDLQIEKIFLEIIKKGEDKGLIWANITFDGYVFNSEELAIGNEIKDKGFLVDNHIRISDGDKIFTIIGIQLILFNNEYKVKGDEIRGIFEIDLNVYVPADDMYLDEMEENGY